MKNSNDFATIASHELRAPVTIIRGFAEVLQNHPDLTQEKIHEVSEKIVGASVRLERMLQALLRLSDIESEAPFQEVKLRPLVEACKSAVLMKYPAARISIDCDAEDVATIGDADLLELAIINLLENGIKYSEGRMEVHISEGKIAFQDHGIGIAAKDLPHIFDPFYAVDKKKSRKLGGAGLGLSIVKAIVEKHGGKVSVTSEVGRGSLFILTFAV